MEEKIVEKPVQVTVPAGTHIPVQESKPRPVMQEEFSSFKSEVNNGFAAILGKLEELKTPAAVPAKPAPAKVVAGPDEETPVPVNWVKAVHEILGPDFDCRFEQPDSGGAKFTIIVPAEKSNATKDYLAMYKRDWRSREIGNTGLGGVKEWALLVRNNLLASGTKLVQYP